MSVKNREAPFTVSDFEGSDTFPGIIELGFNDRGHFVVAAWLSPPPDPRGRYFTSLPISDLKYRRRHADSGSAYWRKSKDELVIYDDWRRWHSIKAPSDILDALVSECIAQEISEVVEHKP